MEYAYRLLLLRTGDHLFTVSLQAWGQSSTQTFVKCHITKPSAVEVPVPSGTVTDNGTVVLSH